MLRTTRLLSILQTLRSYNHPVTASTLASKFEISERTLYRDVAALVELGVPISGEAGVGYLLRPGFFLPPLMFSQDEIEAIGLGLQYVNQRGDMILINAARQAYTKIKAALPTTSQDILEFPAICAGPLLTSFPQNAVSLSVLRTAISQRIKLHIIYNDTKGGTSDSIVWPFALLFLNDTRVMLAKDELSGGCRTLRTDKILRAESLNNPYPEWRINLVREYCDYMILHGFNIE